MTDSTTELEDKLAALRMEHAELQQECKRALELNYVLRRRLDSVAEERDYERELREHAAKVLFSPHVVLTEAERLLRDVGVFCALFHDSRVAITREDDNAWVPTLADGYAYFAERCDNPEGG